MIFKYSIPVVRRSLAYLSMVSVLGVMAACNQSNNSRKIVRNALILDMEFVNLLGQSNKIVIRSSLTNNLGNPVTFLPWNTPFDQSVTGHFFSIIDTGSNTELSYIGRMVKRLPPSDGDYILVSSNQIISNDLDISSSYDFCSGRQYRLVFTGALNDKKSKTLPVQSKSLNFTLGEGFGDC